MEMPRPYEPLVSEIAVPGKTITRQPSWLRRVKRRAQIYAEVRRQMAVDGYEFMVSRKVADACGITVQTLHNSFGDRTQLIVQALNDHTLAIDSYAKSMANHPLLFLVLADAYSSCAIETPEFLRQLVTSAFSEKKPLLSMLHGFGARNKRNLLIEIAARDMLRAGVDCEFLANKISLMNCVTTYEWAKATRAPSDLRVELISAIGLLLMGAVKATAASRIEEWLGDNLHKAASPDMPSSACLSH